MSNATQASGENSVPGMPAGVTGERIALADREARGFVIPLGPVDLVLAVTASGMLCCGAFDVAALDRFSYPAVKAKASAGGSIATVADLLAAEVTVANAAAAARGITVGMSGRDALELL